MYSDGESTRAAVLVRLFLNHFERLHLTDVDDYRVTKSVVAIWRYSWRM